MSALIKKGKPPCGARRRPQRWLRLPIFCLFVLATGIAATGARAAPAAADEDQLRTFARALRYAPSKQAGRLAYDRLAAFARRAPAPLNARAALALGHFAHSQKNYGQASVWFRRAQSDPVLRQYAIFWEAQSELGGGRSDRALSLLETFRHDFPESVLTESAVESLAEAAVAARRPERALAGLSSYPKTSLRPKLLFLEGVAQETTGALSKAAKSYLAVRDRFPLSEFAEQAGRHLAVLELKLGPQFPAPLLGEQVTRAEILYLAHRWREAREAYRGVLARLSGPDRERAELRVAECESEITLYPKPLANLALSDALLDAERLATLVGLYRARQDERAMLDAVEQAVARDPGGLWAAQALFEAGNAYWVNLNRSRAATFYGRAAEKSPGGKLAASAEWRVAWAAYLAEDPNRAESLEQYLRKFPASPAVPDALYWLGRAAERANDLPRARAWYEAAVARFAQNYFGLLAEQRLGAIGREPRAAVDLPLAPVPAAAWPALTGSVPASVAEQFARAEALRTAAFDASAELEFNAAYEETGAPRLLFEAARAARDAREYMLAAKLARGLGPDVEARPVEDVPVEIWRLVYPLPFSAEIDAAASEVKVDPMLLAGLIRQESGFDAQAVSSAGALGLMQLLPKTARVEARDLRLRYSRQRLFDPGYNLRLGAAHLAGLLAELGGLEQALAAYNAGRDRVAAWRVGGPFDEPAEFVESIPFTETRQYVEIVVRNAELYRRLYEAAR